MAEPQVALPEGFTLDAPELPEGFSLDDEIERNDEIERIPGEPLERKRVPEQVIRTETGPFSPTGGRSFVQPEYTEPDTEYQKRQARHFGFEAPPEWARDNYARLEEALGFTPGEPENMRKIVEKAFGDQAELKFHEGYGEHVIEFKSGELVPFNPAGLDIGDVRGLRAEAGIMAAEVGTASAGMLAGMPAGPAGAAAGAIAGAPLGAGLGKYAALQRGKEAGFHDMTEPEMLGAAAYEAAVALGGEALLGGGGMMVRRFIANPQVKRFFGELTEEQVDEAVKYAENLNARVLERTGEDLGATTGQVVTQIAPEAGRKIQTFERGLEAKGAEVGAGARASQQRAEEAVKRQMFGEVPENLEGAAPFGEAVQEVAEQRLARSREEIVMNAHEQRAEAVAKQLDIADAPATLTTAEETRAWLKNARDETFAALGDRYKAFWAGVPDETYINLHGLRKTAKKWDNILKKDIFPSLTEEDARLVKSALRAGLQERDVPAFDPEGLLVSKRIVEDVGGTFDQVSRAISTLKAEQRYLSNVPGAAKAREAKMLGQLIDELDAARDAALEGIDPALRAELDALDTAYRVAKEEIDLSLVNRIITRKKGGGWRISDDKMFDSILRSRSESRNLARIISNPEYAAFNTQEGIRKGIMGAYRDRVIDGTMTHKSFMKQYGEGIEQFFSPVEMRRFDSLEKASAMIRVADENEKSLLRGLEKTFGHKVTTWNPEDVLTRTAGNLSETRRLKELLRDHPGKWEQYKALRSRMLLNQVESVDDVGNKLVNFEQLDTILSSEKGELREVYGSQFIADAELLSDISKLRRVPKSVSSGLTSALKEVESTPTLLLWRAMYARPLSRLGLITTSTLKLDRQAARSATAKLLADPELLRKAMNLYRRDSSWDMWRRFMSNIGAAELARQAEDALNE